MMLRLKGVALMGIVGACRGLWGGQGLGDRQEWEVSTTENAFSSGSRIEFEWVAKAKNSTQLGMLFVFLGQLSGSGRRRCGYVYTNAKRASLRVPHCHSSTLHSSPLQIPTSDLNIFVHTEQYSVSGFGCVAAFQR